MENKDELKEIDIENRVCYYFDIIKDIYIYIYIYIYILILVIFYWAKNYMKIFQFMIFETKLQQIQNYCILGSIK